MIIRSSVGKPFLNSKTLSELSKPFYSLHNAHRNSKIGESVNFEITLKLNTSFSELQTLRKPAQNKSTQHTKWNKRVKFENRSHNALWSCIFSEVQKLVDVSLPNSKWKQRVRVLNQNMLAKHGWFLISNADPALSVCMTGGIDFCSVVVHIWHKVALIDYKKKLDLRKS